MSRLLAEKLAERFGQSVVVENSATTGVAAWSSVAKASPDGYLLSMLTGAFSARAAVAKSLPYDPIKDFSFITMISGYPMVVATAANSPIKSFAELIARAKAAPYDVTYGMNLPGSVHHLTGELINVEAGTSLRGIPYRGNSQIVQDLLGGRLDVMIETGTIAFGQIRSGTLRGLAVSSRERFVLAAGHSGHRRDAAGIRGHLLAGARCAGGGAEADRRSDQQRDRRHPRPARHSGKAGQRGQCADADQPGTDARLYRA